ncbi:MAG: UDP-3-O-3-hydroxymyristoyl N-acetylglucosamine deacetylase [bacterium]|nr:MAG: UDP-3-O-3-hydroxymyristoyl N-acetylglucosamine deacetylase [bacterium]
MTLFISQNFASNQLNVSSPQRTIKQSVSCQGRGLHTGCEVKMTLKPAPPNSGICFRRIDLSEFEIPASIEYVARVSYATTLMRLGVMVATVEHLLSALAGCQIDNCIVELDSLEVPIMDGSAREFINLINSAGIIEQSAKRVCLKVLEPVEVHDSNRWIKIEPASELSINSTIDFSHPLIGKQKLNYKFSFNSYVEEIASARTFGFAKELDTLRRAGLIRGGSLENAIVLTDDGLMNNEGLRFADEFARHKVLDILGDLALTGRPIIGKVTAERSGHALHAQLVSQLLRNSNSWELVEQSDLQLAVGSR